MCVCVRKMRDMETLNSRKLLGLRGTLFLVSVIGLCSGVLCLCNFDTLTDVRVRWNMQDKDTLDGRKLLGLRGTLFLVPVIGICLVVLFRNFDTQTDVRVYGKCKTRIRWTEKIAWAEGNPLLGLCDWTLSCCSFSWYFRHTD